MDWPNERYVRVYTRDTTTWKLMDWRGRTVLSLLIRKVDRAGVLDVGHDGVLGLAAVLELPLEIVEAGIAQLTTSRGGQPTVVDTGTAYVLPNYIEAQEASASDPQRKRESRARRRDRSLAAARGLLPADETGHGGPDGHETGRGQDGNTDEVTPIRSEPIRSVPDQNSLSHAIPPSPVPVPPEPNVPVVSPPPALRKDIARTQPAPYDHTDDRSRGRLAEATYQRVSDARVAIAAGLRLPAQLPFPPITPSSRARAFCELLDRVREEGAGAPAACDRVVASLIAQARESRGPEALEWLSQKAFSAGAWATARERVPGARRSRPGAKPEPVAATAPVPTKRETALPVVVSAAERAEAAEMALELRARLFGEARAPPAPASSSPTPDQQPTPERNPA